MNKEILKLIAGFRRFRTRYYNTEDSIYRRLLNSGQSPKTLMIACSDSRVDPAILSDASPGEIFVVRNVANLVPPCEASVGNYHGVSAAIEFAVVNLKVENIVVLGHRQCGGIRALVLNQNAVEGSFVTQWMKIAKPAREKIIATFGQPKLDGEGSTISEHDDNLCRHCELESIVISLDNLRTFPFVAQAIAEGRLSLHGAYFDLESGELYDFDHDARSFHVIKV